MCHSVRLVRSTCAGDTTIGFACELGTWALWGSFKHFLALWIFGYVRLVLDIVYICLYAM